MSTMRSDGRGLSEYREVSVSSNIFAHTCGSARAVLGGGLGGGTEVIAGVSAEIDVPRADAPDCGWFEVCVEYSPTIAGGDDKAQQAKMLEHQRTLQKLLDGAMDMKALGVVSGAFCWKVTIDILVVAEEGGLLDTISLAIYVALARAKVPRANALVADGGEPDFELATDEETFKLCVDRVPIIITVAKGRDAQLLIDANEVEASTAESSICVAVNRQQQICSVDQAGGSFAWAQLSSAIALAETISTGVFHGLDESINHDQAAETE